MRTLKYLSSTHLPLGVKWWYKVNHHTYLAVIKDINKDRHGKCQTLKTCEII